MITLVYRKLPTVFFKINRESIMLFDTFKKDLGKLGYM